MHFQRRFDDLGFKIGYAAPATLAMSWSHKGPADVAWALLANRLPYSDLKERMAQKIYARSFEGKEDARMQRVLDSLTIDGKPQNCTNGIMPFQFARKVVVPKARSSAVPIKKVMLGRDSDGHAYTLEEFREFFGPEDYLWYWNHKGVSVVRRH